MLVDTTSTEARNRALFASVGVADRPARRRPLSNSSARSTLSSWCPVTTNPLLARWESDCLLGNLHRAYRELDGKPLTERFELLRVWSDVTELHAGPIACHA
ncbi:hypothetical protein [Lentzea roselyniae]|uniref:hypothetical protein n=1 Tax=Lentzea roselyniae TaxID=531940 RepID=UPI0031F92A1D